MPLPPFFGTRGPRNAPIVVVGEAWGENEAAAQKPFVGLSGRELENMLSDAGIPVAEVFFTNVCPRRPPSNDMKFFFERTADARKAGFTFIRGLCPSPETRGDIGRLYSELNAIKPRVIVPLGNYALWALTESNFGVADDEGYKVPTGITKWRGSYLEWNVGNDPEVRTPLVPTYHPAAIMRQWSWRAAAVHDLRVRVAPLARGTSVPYPDYNFTIRPTFEQAIDALEFLLRLPAGSWITCDLETRLGHIACLGFAWSATDAVCIPLMCVENDYGYWTQDEEASIRSHLQALLARRDIRWSNQNILYDMQYLDYWLWEVPTPSHDTMVAHHLCWPGTPKDLGYLSSLYCRYHRYWKEDGRYWDPATMPEEQLWRYNCVDAVTTWEITQELERLIDTLGFRELFTDRLEQLAVAFDMMRRGVRVDEKARSKLYFEFDDAIQKRDAELSQLMPPDLPPLLAGKTAKSQWYRSPTQQAKFFYDLCGVPEVFDRKTKRRTCDDDALNKIALKAPLLQPITERLQETRSLLVIRNGILSAPADPDGRMRCSFNPAGTDTFRYSSSENAFGRGTNLQNISKGEDE
jgi:DNA polymerase